MGDTWVTQASNLRLLKLFCMCVHVLCFGCGVGIMVGYLALSERVWEGFNCMNIN